MYIDTGRPQCPDRHHLTSSSCIYVRMPLCALSVIIDVFCHFCPVAKLFITKTAAEILFSRCFGDCYMYFVHWL